jgi:hypothetical protein
MPHKMRLFHWFIKFKFSIIFCSIKIRLDFINSVTKGSRKGGKIKAVFLNARVQLIFGNKYGLCSFLLY